MTGVTWRELPPGAPEPPPLTIVRTRGLGERCWARTQTGWWRINGITNTGPTPWATVLDDGLGVDVAEPDDAYVPWPVPGETVLEAVEPSDYEIRHAALDAAARLGWGEETQRGDVVAQAREFEAYLRDGAPVLDQNQQGAVDRARAAFADAAAKMLGGGIPPVATSKDSA